jgi:hypothetical protein
MFRIFFPQAVQKSSRVSLNITLETILYVAFLFKKQKYNLNIILAINLEW